MAGMTDQEREQAAAVVRAVFHAEAAGVDSVEIAPFVEADVNVLAAVLRNETDPLPMALRMLHNCQRVSRWAGWRKGMLQ